MGRKILGILVCMLFLFTIVSTVSAKQERTVYKNCYIEVEAQSEGLYNMVKYFFIRPTGNTNAFVFYWILQWMGPEDVTVKIFNQKNGNELWNNQNQEGIWATKLFFFKGLYTWSTENGQDIMILQGKTRTTIILWDE